MSINDIFTLAIAGIAFIFSLLSFAYTVLTGPRIQLLFGGEILLAYTAERALYILSDFVFFNQGAQPGAVVELHGTLSRAHGSEKIPLRWTDFYENKFFQEKGEFWYVPQGKPHTIVVSGRAVGGTEKQGIGFQTSSLAEHDWLQAGEYQLELLGLVGPRLKTKCKAKATLTLSASDSSYLAQYCHTDTTTGNILHYLRCSRDPISVARFVSSGPNVSKTTGVAPSKSQQ